MSKSILNTYAGGGSTLTIEPADKANLIEIPTVQNGLSRETIYVYVGSDAEHALNFRVGYYPNPGANGGKGQVNISVKATSYVYDSVLGTYDPMSATLAWTMPGQAGVADVTTMSLLLQNLLSLVLPAGADAFATSALARLAFGITGGLAAISDVA